MAAVPVKLYGGAITCQIPSTFQDLSAYVPVPDYQEVYVQHAEGTGAPGVNAPSDRVLTFEILQHLEGMDEISAGSHLFQDLSVCNESRKSQICTCKVVGDVDIGLSSPSRAVVVTGRMSVSRRKFKTEESWEDVSVLMYIVRIPKHNSEFLITYTFPTSENALEHESVFEAIVKTARIVDANLFTHQ